MKKFAFILAACSALVNPMSASAADYSRGGRGAAASASASSGDFNWIAGVIGLGVVATVVGIVVASAADSPNTFSH